MSDQMTHLEIEDVLSSIRRLVSEDGRPAGRAPAVPANTPGKLVLTPALRIVSAAPSAVAVPLPPPAAQPADPAPLSHEAAAAALEAALSARAEEWEPDGSEAAAGWGIADWQAAPAPTRPAGPAADAPDASAAAPAPERAAAPPPAPVAERSAEAAGAEDEAFLFDDEQGESGFDEEALRDLMRDILREELQGMLGERITRNVRKLVRAEINRAFAARDFD